MPETPSLQVRCDAAVGSLRLQTDLSLHAPWTVIFGPSGSGKSSLLRLIAGLWQPKDAMVRVGSHDLSLLPPHRRGVGVAAQQPALFPHMTVRQNVAFGAPVADVSQVLLDFDLQPFAAALPATLSGGERQRVAIARALASEPKLLLLDEVFSGMHRAQRDALVVKLRAAGQVHRMPIVSVTHDVAEAFLCADEVMRIADGRVVAQGSAAEVLAVERDTLLRQLQP